MLLVPDFDLEKHGETPQANIARLVSPKVRSVDYIVRRFRNAGWLNALVVAVYSRCPQNRRVAQFAKPLHAVFGTQPKFVGTGTTV